MGVKAVTRNRTGNSAQHSDAWATSVKARLNCRYREPADSGLQAGSKRTRLRGLDVCYCPGFTTTSNPANSAALHVASNCFRERGNPPRPLHDGAAGPAHGCGRVGWAQKPRPAGKPPDTLTGPPQNQGRVAAMSQTSVSNRDDPGMYDWQGIPWPQAERKLHKLQRRIYRASQRNDCKTVHALQRLLLRSWYAKLLAVRRVTQDNQGKKTPGIDGIASLEPAERLDLVHSLHLDARPQPIRRVWIPKPGSDEQKTRLCHTLHAQDDPVGFDFLGFTVRQFPVGKYHTGTNSRGTPLGFKTNIKPSKRKVQLHLHRLADLIRHGGNLTQEDLIRRLNPIIRGWSNYYRTVVSAQTFGHCDH